MTDNLKFLSTTVTPTAVHLRCADHNAPSEAGAWIDIQMPVAELKRPTASDAPLRDPDSEHFSDIRLAALQRARDVITGEIQRLSALAGRRSK